MQGVPSVVAGTTADHHKKCMAPFCPEDASYTLMIRRFHLRNFKFEVNLMFCVVMALACQQLRFFPSNKNFE
jgi:hypothetical protein